MSTAPPRSRPDGGMPTGRHPIQVVARRTGLSVDVIRAWEKRYGVVTPVRSDAGRRLYSDADVRRLRLLAQATRTGHAVGQVVALSSDALTELLRDETAPSGAVADDATPRPDPLLAEHLRTCLDAIARFDPFALDAALRRATIALSAEAFLGGVVVPLWQHVADGARDGTVRPPQRHLAQAVLRRVLDRMTEAATLPDAGPDLIVATPSGHGHELGALLTAAAAATEGWRVVYLGPGLPAEDIAEAAERARSGAVAPHRGEAPDDRVIASELRRLRTLLPGDIAIVVAGAAGEAHRGVVREIGASVLRDVPTLLARLRALRAESLAHDRA